MKYLTTLIIFFFWVNSNAQLQEILTQNDWYLYSLTINEEEIMPPVNGEMPFVSLNFDDDLININLWTQACNTGLGLVEIDEVNYAFSFVDGMFDVTLLLCDIEENNIFDTHYYSFLINNLDHPYTTYITFIDDPNSNEELISLEVVSENGDIAFYNNWLLNNEDFTKSQFEIYPNPVKEIFYISTNTQKNLDVFLYDITGKLIFKKSGLKSQDPINIENIKPGIYFVSMIDEDRNTSVERIIKK